REHAMQGGDARPARANVEHELPGARFHGPARPGAAVPLDVDERTQLFLDAGLAAEGDAQAVSGLDPLEQSLRAELEPAIALCRQTSWCELACDWWGAVLNGHGLPPCRWCGIDRRPSSFLKSA